MKGLVFCCGVSLGRDCLIGLADVGTVTSGAVAFSAATLTASADSSVVVSTGGVRMELKAQKTAMIITTKTAMPAITICFLEAEFPRLFSTL